MSQNTVRAYRADLEGLLNWGTWSGGTMKELEAHAASYLNNGRLTWAPKTTVRKLGTFKSFAEWAGDPNFLKLYRPPSPAQQQPHPIPEGIDGVKLMIASTTNPIHKSLIALMGLMGLRVEEAITVRPSNFNLSDMTLLVRGKGDKDRIIPIGKLAWAAIEKRYRQCLATDERIVRRSNRGARGSVTRHAQRARLSRHVASHDLRATAATAAYQNTKDLRAVQELLGHADPKTTMVYTGISMDSMRSAVDFA